MTARIPCQAYYVHHVNCIMSFCQLIGRWCLWGDTGRLYTDLRLI